MYSGNILQSRTLVWKKSLKQDSGDVGLKHFAYFEKGKWG